MLQRQPATAASVPATISSAVSDGPEANRRRTLALDVSALTCEPPTSTARTTGLATTLRLGGLRLSLASAPRPFEQERVETEATAARLGCRDRHFHLELVVAELLDAVAAVYQWPSGAFVAISSQLALPLLVAPGWVELISGRQVFHRTGRACVESC